MTNLIKWLVLAVLTGLSVGFISSLFARVLKFVTNYRTEHFWIFFLLPVSGLIIVFLYQKFGQEDGGTNQVLSTIRSQDDVPFRSAPLIFVSTILTHFAGGSAGREGAAIQLGGSIGNQLGSWFHLDEEDRHVMVMCGMSAAFSAVFGTPMAAAVFSMEVVSVGIMYYAALVPCVIASIIASKFAAGFGINPESFHRNRTQDGSCCRCLCCHQYYFLYSTSGCQQTLCEIFKKSIYPYRRSQCHHYCDHTLFAHL